MTSNEIRRKYIDFFVKRNHQEIPSAPLVPQNDPTTLFVSAGMQPLVPYLLGVPNAQGKRLVDVQKCMRTDDINEVGDAYHHTFFEMLGNWSLGDYFKKESITWSYEFLTHQLHVNPNRLWVSIFAGDKDAPRDEEALEIWQAVGIPKQRIIYLGKSDNWWAAGNTGPCGPDTEIFYDTTQTSHGANCQPGDNCGRFVEIWNNVFMVYNRKDDQSLNELPNKNVDTGMGIERTLAVLNGFDDNYQTDLFKPIIEAIFNLYGVNYQDSQYQSAIRVIADHIKASVFLINDGVLPSNKLQGYILRRLLRRAAIKSHLLKENSLYTLIELVGPVFEIYKDTNYLNSESLDLIKQTIHDELNKFNNSLNKGLKEIQKIDRIDGKQAFDLYQTYGFPWELTIELVSKKGQTINKKEFESEFNKHRDLSRTATAGMFKGGLADQSQQTVKLHTTHHLLLAALQKIVDPTIKQRGSNITADRLRIDFNLNHGLTGEAKQQVEDLVNQKIQEGLPVNRIEMRKEIAESVGAQMEFGTKYPDLVSVYFVGLHAEIKPENATPNDYFSAEFCGGPHVTNTSEIGADDKKFKIIKEESVGSGVRRIKAMIV